LFSQRGSYQFVIHYPVPPWLRLADRRGSCTHSDIRLLREWIAALPGVRGRNATLFIHSGSSVPCA